MIFKIYGLVKWKGKKIANGIDGRFETSEERVINILKQKGFEEIKEEKVIVKTASGELAPVPLEKKHEPKKGKKVPARGKENNRRKRSIVRNADVQADSSHAVENAAHDSDENHIQV